MVLGAARKPFRIQSIQIGLKCTCQHDLKPFNNALFQKRPVLHFGRLFCFNDRKICLGMTRVCICIYIYIYIYMHFQQISATRSRDPIQFGQIQITVVCPIVFHSKFNLLDLSYLSYLIKMYIFIDKRFIFKQFFYESCFRLSFTK